MAIFTKEHIKDSIVGLLAVNLLREMIDKDFIFIDHTKLLETEALRIGDDSKTLEYVIGMAKVDNAGAEVADYFDAVVAKRSLDIFGGIKKDEFHLDNIPLFKVKICEYQKKKLFKREIFKAVLVRSELLDDICKAMQRLAESSGSNVYFGYAYGEKLLYPGAQLTTTTEDHVFNREELQSLEKKYFYYTNGAHASVGGFIASLKYPITDGSVKK